MSKNGLKRHQKERRTQLLVRGSHGIATNVRYERIELFFGLSSDLLGPFSTASQEV